MQESRLFKIVYYLLEKGQATAPELAEKFEVSVRTIYRDIDALSGAGIPVYTETGRGGGIYLMKDFVLDKAVLSAEEKQEILTALQSLHTTQNIHDSQTMQKLCALFRLGLQDWLEVDFSRWGNDGFDHEKFEGLKSAVLHNQAVKIHYAISRGKRSVTSGYSCPQVAAGFGKGRGEKDSFKISNAKMRFNLKNRQSCLSVQKAFKYHAFAL